MLRVVVVRLLVLLTTLAAFGAAAQIVYFGRDEGGNLAVIKEPPPELNTTPPPRKLQPPKSSQVAKQSKAAVKSPPAHQAKDQSAIAPGELVLYAADWCKYCRQARQYLREQGISYTVIDIESPLGRNAFALFGEGKGIPLLVDGDRKLRGFSPEYYDSFLSKRQN